MTVSTDTLEILRRLRERTEQTYNPSAPLGRHVRDAVVAEIDLYLAPPNASLNPPLGPANSHWDGSRWVSGAVAPPPAAPPPGPYPTGYVHGSYVPPPMVPQPEQLQGSPAPTIQRQVWQPSPMVPTAPVPNFPGLMPTGPLQYAGSPPPQPVAPPPAQPVDDSALATLPPEVREQVLRARAAAVAPSGAPSAPGGLAPAVAAQVAQARAAAGADL